ncbi:MAG: alpha/beta hydrolase [Gammaproteobacteria bacterium]|jgi:pimeloyl-ACP methyl ester carboxylesterase|nr:alpha/beta hydrolase [Gammaproteobacteria bacterium]
MTRHKQPVIPSQLFGKGPRPLLFAHANGFPAGAYRSLLANLETECTIYAPALRPLWQSLGEFRNIYRDNQLWRRMAADQIAFIEHHNLAPVTYVGHSMGAVVGLLAAHHKPHLFRRLIMVEPVFLKARYTRIMRYMPSALKRQVPIVKKALGRPDRWSSMQEAFDFHRSRRVFSGFSDSVLWDYINAGVGAINKHGLPTAEFGLLFDKNWEALVYGTVPNTWNILRQTQVPIDLLRAEHSDTVDDASWQRWQALSGPKRGVNFAGAQHLLPLDQPDLVARTILDMVSQDPIL